MQLSEDGNYMWNGSEWVPVEQAPAEEATSVIAAPDEMASTVEEIASPVEMEQTTEPQTVMVTQQVIAPVEIMVGSNTPKPAINIAAALSVFKYGIIALGGWIVSMILLTIVWGASVYMALDSGGTTGMIILVATLLVTIIAYGQMIIYPVGKALKDGRSDNVSFSYIDSWKTSIAGFIESVIVTITLALMIGIGIGYDVPALGYIGGFGFVFFAMGYVPYMVRKAAEIMR